MAIHLFLGIYERLPSYRRNLQLSKEKSQQIKHEIFSLSLFFEPSWILI
jgi:hypothetical protein